MCKPCEVAHLSEADRARVHQAQERAQELVREVEERTRHRISEFRGVVRARRQRVLGIIQDPIRLLRREPRPDPALTAWIEATRDRYKAVQALTEGKLSETLEPSRTVDVDYVVVRRSASTKKEDR